MTTYTNFNRYECMDADTLSDILDLTRLIWSHGYYVGVDTDVLENSICGLMDGYLYSTLREELDAIAPSPELRKKVLRIIEICESYPKTNGDVMEH